jgi:hypothetical protein
LSTCCSAHVWSSAPTTSLQLNLRVFLVNDARARPLRRQAAALLILSRRHQFVAELASKPRVSIASNSPFFLSRFVLCIVAHRHLHAQLY